MIDLSYAIAAFESYLDGFDRSNDKINLKLVHTYGVMDYAKKLCDRMRVSEEENDLAVLIALLHDIGRFEQIVRFDSFEPATMDHATFGVELLFGKENRIRRFIKDDSWDEIIRQAIACHSDFELPVIEDERALFHAKMIRDTDKLDNCRVKLVDSMNILLGMTPEEVGALPISDPIWETVCEKKCIRSADRVTRMDYWVSYIAYFYDINFPESCAIILENHFPEKIIARIPYTHPKTKERMKQLEANILADLRSRVENSCCNEGVNG